MNLEPQICRACLGSDCLELWENFQLSRQLFENISGIKIDDTKYCERFVCTKCITSLESISDFLDVANFSNSLFKNSKSPICLRETEPHYNEIQDPLHRMNESQQIVDDNDSRNDELIQHESENHSDNGLNEKCYASDDSNNIPLSDGAQEDMNTNRYLQHATSSSTESSYDTSSNNSSNDMMNIKPKRSSRKSKKFSVPDYLRPYECPYCSKRFTQKGNMQTHTRLHTGEKPFHCTFCPEKFRQLSNLNQHIFGHISNEKMCNICLKKYDSNEELMEHRSTHASDKQYLCYVCSKKFSYQWSLYTHLEIHKKNLRK